MRFSKGFFPTLKEAPKDAVTPSHVLLLRAGFIRMIGSGIYEILPLGVRVMQKIENLIREEMNASDAQEVRMPALLPSEYFKESGRWDSFGDALFRLQDRKKGDYHLGPTHEEIITNMVRKVVRSYKQLPLNLYQIQNKFRDEPRPRAGLLRCREFTMKDAYSFDVDEASAFKTYDQMKKTYHRIFKRLGLDYRIVQADSGAMGGSKSAEFQILTQQGEDKIVACSQCNYAANVEVAISALPTTSKDTAPAETRQEVHTPQKHSVEEISALLDVPPEKVLKSLVFVADEQIVMAIVRGDHEVNDIRLAQHLGASKVRLAGKKEVEKATNAALGYAGPVGFEGKILVDPAAAEVANAIVGANKTDYHLKNVNFKKDFEAEVVDLRFVIEGDLCIRCNGSLKSYRGIEGGHIFVLGTHYSEKMDATFLDTDGKDQPLVMGCYGIGVTRLMAACVEQNHDEGGICWPTSIAPFQVVLIPIGKDDEITEIAEKLYTDLQSDGIDTLLDDRDERPGIKFKDADLLGIPVRITLGKKSLAEHKVEIKARKAKDPEFVPIDQCRDRIQTVLQSDSNKD